MDMWPAEGPDLDALAFDMMADDPFEWRLEMGFLTPPDEGPEEDEIFEDEEPEYDGPDYDGPEDDFDPDGWMAAQDRYDAMVYGP